MLRDSCAVHTLAERSIWAVSQGKRLCAYDAGAMIGGRYDGDMRAVIMRVLVVAIPGSSRTILCRYSCVHRQ